MAATKEKVGFIFECGRDGPDYKVCQYLLGKLNGNIEMVARFLDNKQRLLSECGAVAAQLLTTCSRVVVVWDLVPPWGTGKPCRHEDREQAFQSLKDAEGTSSEGNTDLHRTRAGVLAHGRYTSLGDGCVETQAPTSTQQQTEGLSQTGPPD